MLPTVGGGAVKRVLLVLGATMPLAIVCAPSASAYGVSQTTSQTIAATPVQRGKESFRTLCAECHGEQGRGDGPSASGLTPRPTDLTTLARRNRGKFSAAHVKAIIKGDEFHVGHDTPRMGTWGVYFSAVTGDDKKADKRISDLVKFIESLQAR